jgi:hypothetical protein
MPNTPGGYVPPPQGGYVPPAAPYAPPPGGYVPPAPSKPHKTTFVEAIGGGYFALMIIGIFLLFSPFYIISLIFNTIALVRCAKKSRSGGIAVNIIALVIAALCTVALAISYSSY